jgi:hypothetical protein
MASVLANYLELKMSHELNSMGGYLHYYAEFELRTSHLFTLRVKFQAIKQLNKKKINNSAYQYSCGLKFSPFFKFLR